MNKKGVIAEKTGFYIIFIFLFTFAFLYAVSFLKVDKAEFNTEEIEDSIIATRVLNCFSSSEFGVMDEEKIIRSELLKCFVGGKYFLKVDLDRKDGEDKSFSNVPGELHNPRTIRRYVKLNDEDAILEISYVKNLRRYEENVA